MVPAAFGQPTIVMAGDFCSVATATSAIASTVDHSRQPRLPAWKPNSRHVEVKAASQAVPKGPERRRGHDASFRQRRFTSPQIPAQATAPDRQSRPRGPLLVLAEGARRW